MSLELPAGYIVFSLEPTRLTPGRLRLRFPEMRHHHEFFDAMKEELQEIPDVLELDIRLHTGSVLLQFDGPLDGIITSLRSSNQFKLVGREEIPKENFDIPVPKFTEKEVMTLKFFVYGGLAIVQALNGRRLGPATSLLGPAMEYWDEIASLAE